MLSLQCFRRASTAARQIKPEQVTKAANGLTVASKDQEGALSQLVLAFRAGSRYEDAHKKGLIHHLKNFVGRDAKDYGGVPLLWSAHSIGAQVTAFATRDLYGVRLCVPRDQTSVALSILGHLAAAPSFKPWELEEIQPTLMNDLAYQKPFDIVFEDIHSAAYRNGSLARSVFACSSAIGKINSSQFEKFAADNLVSGKGVLYGTNIEHDRIFSYGENHSPITEGSGAPAPSSPYKGGERRREGASRYAHVLLAGEGSSATDEKALAVQAVLLAALGKGTSTKFAGNSGNGAVSKAVHANGVCYAMQAPYEGAGLVGVYLVAEPQNIATVVRSAVAAVKNLSAANIDSLKNQAKLDYLRADAHSGDAAVERAAQLLAGVSDGAIVSAIEKVSAQEVEAASKKFTSNFSIASYGSIDNVPYRDQL